MNLDATKLMFAVFAVIVSLFTIAWLPMCSFIMLLLLLFIAFKIANIIFWSWWMVMSPLWIIPVFYIVMFCILVIPGLIVDSIAHLWNKIKGDKI